MKAARPVRRGADGKVLRQCGVTRRRPTLHGAYMYLTASGAPNQMERGKAAMMTALAGIVLALVAYGVVELVMNAVVGNAGGRGRARPHQLRHWHNHRRRRRLGGME